MNWSWTGGWSSSTGRSDDGRRVIRTTHDGVLRSVLFVDDDRPDTLALGEHVVWLQENGL
jgi:hypothetical protein